MLHILGTLRHPLCISCISTCTHMHTLLYSLHSCVMCLFTWLITFIFFVYVLGFTYVLIWFEMLSILFWTNLNLIKFLCSVFWVFALVSFLICVHLCKCLHLKAQLWKEAATKETSMWLMLIISLQSQRGLDHQYEF